MKFVFDIDGTICSVESNYKNAKPFEKNISIINELYKHGNTIWFYTARGTETGIKWRKVTRAQLNSWGVKYHKIIFKKPSADVYVDDKAVNSKEFFK